MALASLLLALASTAVATSPIQLNDSTRTAGRLDGRVLTVQLVADMGTWRPDGPKGAPLAVAAFGEDGTALSVPGPFIRGVEGTTVVVTLRNALGSELHVWGLCAGAVPCDPVTVTAGSSREIRFTLTAPGTYYYWASSSARSMTSRPRVESQLGGAIVVDPRGGAAADRILIISALANPQPIGPCAVDVGPDAVFAINGASWPHTTRFRYEADETVRWRVINMSCENHAMHLHGFHFTVDSVGDGTVDRQLSAAERRTVVTEAIAPGRTFTMSWKPTRAGHWLFHCHMVGHMSASRETMHATHDITTHAGMARLVIGVEIAGAKAAAAASPSVPVRRLSLVLTEEPNRYGNRAGYRVQIDGIAAPRLDPGPVPGPVMLLQRGEPVEITVMNRMKEPTAIHWHGIEIDSYFDGVPGFSGSRGHIAPPVEPGRSFVVRMTPPRAGTFIYHTHWHDEAQLAGGIYGALVVMEAGERYDPATDHIVVIGLNGVLIDGAREPFALNGRASPAPITMRAGVPNRLRLINITPNNVALTAFLVDRFETVRWKMLAKDGASVPSPQSEPRIARQQVSVGETYDFEIDATQPRNLWLEVRRGNGEWVLQAPVQVR
jgi:FtsP/CotA-like multicopper oxidase with cupredoxin domain